MTHKFDKSEQNGIDFYFKRELEGDPLDEFEIPAEVLNEEVLLQHDGGIIAKYYQSLLYEFGDTTFAHLKDAKIHFLWKSKGGKSGGNVIWGKCKKPTGELKFYSDADYVILFSADHLFKARIKKWQILALLFHELRHTAIDENGNFITIGHEFEGFNDELETFGAWKPSAKRIVKTAQSLPLFD